MDMDKLPIAALIMQVALDERTKKCWVTGIIGSFYTIMNLVMCIQKEVQEDSINGFYESKREKLYINVVRYDYFLSRCLRPKSMAQTTSYEAHSTVT